MLTKVKTKLSTIFNKAAGDKALFIASAGVLTVAFTAVTGIGAAFIPIVPVLFVSAIAGIYSRLQK